MLFPYVYPPQVIWILRYLSRLPFAPMAAAIAVVGAGAMALAYRAEARAFGVAPGRPIYITTFLLAFGAASLNSFLTGNVAMVLCALIALALPGLIEGRSAPFYLAVAVGSAVKVYYLGFLGLPILLDGAASLPGIALTAL